MEKKKIIIFKDNYELTENEKTVITEGITLLMNKPMRQTFDIIKSKSNYFLDEEILKDMITSSVQRFIEEGQF